MRFLAIALAALTIASFAPLSAEDAPKRSAELQVLDRWVGSWRTEVTNKTTGVTFTSTENRKWSRLGEFVLSDDANELTRKESHFLMTYDPNARVYRTCFIEEAAAILMLGTWNEATQTMTWTGADIVGNKLTGTNRFLDKDHNEWSVTLTTPDGKVVVELSGKQTRQKA
ncbi:MAG TPA: DUF1579 family protein [Tepidisphaeraceae bacterium]|jgi:hypothetical protein